eukprot:3696958-Pleurochrysis_carterae.AAC.1
MRRPPGSTRAAVSSLRLGASSSRCRTGSTRTRAARCGPPTSVRGRARAREREREWGDGRC